MLAWLELYSTGATMIFSAKTYERKEVDLFSFVKISFAKKTNAKTLLRPEHLFVTALVLTI